MWKNWMTWQIWHPIWSYLGFYKPTLQTSVCYKQNQMINEILTDLYLGHDMNACDYDKRTALHLAVAENHYNCVKYLVHTCKVEIHVKDR